MRVLSLFAGVGMFDYAWKQLGWETVAFAEMDKWCQRVLAKHYPTAKIYDDVRDVTYERLKEDGIVANATSAGLSERRQTGQHQGKTEAGAGLEFEPKRCGDVSDTEHDGCDGVYIKEDAARGSRRAPEAVIEFEGQDNVDRRSPSQPTNQPTGIDLICGGFPCQDLSVAGKQAGINGERSGLWSEFARIIGEFRPKYAVIENVSALLSGDGGRWFDRILIDLAEIGYDCEWHCICAGKSDGTLSAGAPHRRERVWIVAHPTNSEWGAGQLIKEQKTIRSQGNNQPGRGGNAADTKHERPQRVRLWQSTKRQAGLCSRTGPHKNQCVHLTGNKRQSESGMGLLAHGIAAGLSRSRWLPEPGIGRVATGVPDRVNKLKALGNGLVWQIPYAIGKAIMQRSAGL